jgi:hypothetical protein
MRNLSVAATAVLLLTLLAPGIGRAQDAPTATPAVPRLITVTGTYQPASGQASPPSAIVTLSVYAVEIGGTPLFQETQTATLDVNGRYSVQLGAAQPDGLPVSLFAEGQERWLGVQFAGPGETEGVRRRLTSVPYALRAADADTLGGRPASAYVLAPTGSSGDAVKTASDVATTPKAADFVPGTPNTLAKYVTTVDVGNSAVVETGGRVGIGTDTPLDSLHIRFTNTNGGLTGFAVQNLGNTNTSYSGMLFYDQFGQTAQFQGFNNVTHEYRINNVASNASINFMTGSVSKFLVAPTGNIGIGTTSPSAPLEISNALSGGTSNLWVTSYTNFVGPYFMARRARGTAGTPTAALSGDGLSGLYGQGYGTTGFGQSSGITIQAAQNFSDTQRGTAITFSTTPMNSTTPATRMTLDATGLLGIGTTSTPAAGILEVSNAANGLGFGNVVASTFSANFNSSLFTGRKARGTAAAPTAVLSGDILVGFEGQGYAAGAFSGTRGGMFLQAAENWTSTAQGTRVSFNTTAAGTNTSSTKMTIDPDGNVGIGTSGPSVPLEVVRTGTDAAIVSTLYANGGGAGAFFAAQAARGTAAAPSAIQAGDLLGALGFNGYGTTDFLEGAAVGAFAAETFSGTASGSALVFAATPLGQTDVVVAMGLLPSGNLGIGTPLDANGIPTATDRLQVFGDVRVGNSGTNGCVKNFAGTQLTGTCVSDRRYKKGITPFSPALDQVAALQPVHFYWRANEFPEQHFGASQAYGLIAQDVEQVLPDLVVTQADGYKAVDYSQLPLLTIQAVKELKAENDALKKQIGQLDELKQRISDLERLVRQLQQPQVNQR